MSIQYVSKNRRTLIDAFRAARPIILAEHDSTITGHSHPEKKERKGVECITYVGYFFHVDTITDRHALADLKKYKRTLRLIDSALKLLGAP